MSRVERFLERLVERPSARLFRTRLQPIQVLRRIERAMEAERDAGGPGRCVPDQFDVRLEPADFASLLPADDVASELASGALSFARDHGYALRDRPRVTLRPDPALRPGEVEVQAIVSRAVVRQDDPEGLHGGTRAYEVPVVRFPSVVLEIREPGGKPRRVPVSGAPIRI